MSVGNVLSYADLHSVIASKRHEAEEYVARVAGTLARPAGDAREKVKSETTILALKCNGGKAVLLGCDGLVTAWGREKYRTNMEKIRPLDVTSAMAICGVAASGIHVTNWLRMVFELYRFNEEKPLSVEGKLEQVDYIAMLWCAYGLTFYPIFAAYDERHDTGRIFDIWGDGGGRDEKEYFYANGSGGKLAMSVLNGSGWHGEGDAREALLLAAKAAHHSCDTEETVNELHHAFIVGKMESGNWSGITWMPPEAIAAANKEARRNCNHPQCNAGKGGA